MNYSFKITSDTLNFLCLDKEFLLLLILFLGKGVLKGKDEFVKVKRIHCRYFSSLRAHY